MDPEPLVIYVPSAVALAAIAGWIGYSHGRTRKRNADAEPTTTMIDESPGDDEQDQ